MAHATFNMRPDGCAVNGIPLYSLEVTAETEVIESLSPIPDPRWTFVDVKGHFHAWSLDYRGMPVLPSLNAVDELVPCDGACGFDGGCEGYTRRHYTCIVCAEPMEPGRIPGPHRPPGRTTYTARVSGPIELFDVLTPGDMVCLTYPGGFDYGFPGGIATRSLSLSGGGGVVETEIIIHPHMHNARMGHSPLQPVAPARQADLARAMLAGADAVRSPWEQLTEDERRRFAHDFATLAAARAITAALPHLGLDPDGRPLP